MKPPYRVPSMQQIARIKPNGFKAISLFAGAGGSSLGYRLSGFRMLWASEFIDAARDVYHRFRTISFCLEAMSSNVKGLAGPSRR
jgi:site-specific DNA-cytosine methylase